MKKKINIHLKEPINGQRVYEFSSDTQDLSEHIALARDKAKLFSFENIEKVCVPITDYKFLDITEVVMSDAPGK